MTGGCRQDKAKLGVVVIGRNEGERLARCLKSIEGELAPIIYVDSGSTDGSVELARSHGAHVVELDVSQPFTMARGRNAGLHKLLDVAADTEFVQFVDGDCEMVVDWLRAGADALHERPDVGSICGWRQERNREASVYNRITDIEWRGKVGEVDFCGGDVMMRIEAFRQVGGYKESMIAGEDPEICVRLRQRGWKLLRLDREMTLHDAAMTRFVQWWKRAVRAGHAYAEQADLHGAYPERCCIKETRSNWFWGLLLPTAIVVTAFPAKGFSLLVFAVYPLWWFRVARRLRAEGHPRVDARAYALFCLLSKFPMAIGQIAYWRNRFLKKRSQLIEYK